MMTNLKAIIHVYRHGDIGYVVPLVQLADGPWQETLPVIVVKPNNPDEMTNALAKARGIAGQELEVAPNAWRSPFGSDLKAADGLCAIRWYKTGNIKVVPQAMRAEDDDGVEQHGWYDVVDSAVELAADNSWQTITGTVLAALDAKRA